MKIKVCEFRARNNPDNQMTYIEVEKEFPYVYYINSKGNRSYKYNTLEEAKEDIKSMYGGWIDFKMLI